MSVQVTHDYVEALLSENPAIKNVKIRVDKKTQKASVIDIVCLVTGQESKNASRTIARLGHDMCARCEHIRINGKGHSTWVADAPTMLQIISALPGKRAAEIQARFCNERHMLKRSFLTLLSTGCAEVNMSRDNKKKLRLSLARAEVLENGEVVRAWDYLNHLNPSQEEALQIAEQVFPTDFSSSATAPEYGCVYFVRIEGTKMVKVGYTTQDIKKRISTLQVSNPGLLELDNLVRTPNYRELERSIHRALRKRHVRGEWFCLESDFDYADLIKQI
uniref:Bacteriophage T5 Orf172 DNA-binding domain-containing protein n=1 Tax=viral metagenome TaxID=1070528 RepID=A0A6C0BQG2_9ZZZZ